ncbi:prephenate dehydrogenase/arogenate dehydrogenase family protein [Verticiella sediminum]|uniref:Prephenate dehydrogenase/arogenate dehydrogenase family protein n=1 Tax=Verticiella sediminum TaxID=1247510 RepID=A0A556AKP9_9BURK|nr:prephenate dehydrogenase/arogenate dehydrogenase family protein [Verticiella sediminum]TSH93466.1 prephenate dehydrogenase/arogenate dehydrogenase family protein [Verticiella sediminum]
MPEAMDVRIPVLAVVGVGLIGGSFAAALRRTGAVGEVIGVGRNAASLAEAEALGLIDRAATAEQAAAEADLVFLSTPVGAMPAVLRAMAPHLRAHAVVTDGGSTKQDVVAAARQGLGECVGQFVPGHPIAGSERSGPSAADPNLYRGRQVILTPLPENTPASIARVESAWRACGAELFRMDPARHDDILASVSHVPHLVAFAFLTHLLRRGDAVERLGHAGSGFRDFSRIAGSSAEMWRDILFANRDAVLAEVGQIQQVLEHYAALLRGGDAEGLEALLAEAAALRRDWLSGIAH